MAPSDAVTHWNVRTATDDDWPAISLLDATGFGWTTDPDEFIAWRAMLAPDAALVVCDAGQVVGSALYLDLQLTVPGGAVLRAAAAFSGC